MAVDVDSIPVSQRPLLPPHSPLLTSSNGSPVTNQPLHIRNRSASLTFHPTAHATHQRNLSRSLSIIAPHTPASAPSHAYVPSQRASQPAVHRAALLQPPTPPPPTAPIRTAPPTTDTSAAALATPKHVTAHSHIHRASLTGFNSGSYKVLLVGAPHSGKTSLLHRLIAQQFDDSYRPTHRIELALYLLKDEQFNSLEVRRGSTCTAMAGSMEVRGGAVLIALCTLLLCCVIAVGRAVWCTHRGRAAAVVHARSVHYQLPASL